MMLTRANACCLSVRLKSNLPACEFLSTGIGALKRKPAVLNWSPMLKSLAGYLAAAAASALIAAGLTPEFGNSALIWAGVSVLRLADDDVQADGATGGKHPKYLTSPRPRFASGTVRTTDSDCVIRSPSKL